MKENIAERVAYRPHQADLRPLAEDNPGEQNVCYQCADYEEEKGENLRHISHFLEI